MSSQPKMRKSRRIQRMRFRRGVHPAPRGPWRGRARAGTRPRTSAGSTARPGIRCSTATTARQHARRRPRCRSRGRRRDAARCADLVRQDPGAHPRQEGADHPPDRVVPPVAAAADLPPAVGVGADVLEQRRRRSGERRPPRRGRCRRRPAMPSMVRARVHRPGRSVTAASADHEDARPSTTVSSGPRVKREASENDEDDNGLEQAELAPPRARSKGTPSGRGRACSSTAEFMPSPDGGGKCEVYADGAERAGQGASAAPAEQRPPTSVTAQAPSARYMPRWCPALEHAPPAGARAAARRARPQRDRQRDPAPASPHAGVHPARTPPQRTGRTRRRRGDRHVQAPAHRRARRRASGRRGARPPRADRAG